MKKLPVATSALGSASDSDKVLSILRAHKPELARQFGVRSLALFGSTSRNESRPSSDIDILVTFERFPRMFQEIFRTEDYLENVLGRKVDLIHEPDLDPRVRAYVEEDLIYA